MTCRPGRSPISCAPRTPSAEVVVEDGLRAMGRGFVLVNERAAGVVFFRFRWLWDATFWLFVGLAPTRRATQALVRKLGSRGVLRLVNEVVPPTSSSRSIR